MAIGTNVLLKSLRRCFSKESLEYLWEIYNDTEMPKQVKKRAHYKIACIWKKYDRQQEIVKNTQKTKLANKRIKEIKEKEKLAALLKK